MYKGEIVKAMNLLSEDSRVIFVGQNVIYGGAIAIDETLKYVSTSRKLELPIAEDFQVGFCLGLSLIGYIPLCVFPRMDFLIIAANQLVNHLDKIEELSACRFKPKVIIRTCIGSTEPLDPGPQHTQDHTEALRHLLKNIDVVKLNRAEEIVLAYQAALKSDKSTILIELASKMR